MLFGGFGCESRYENCGYDQESYVNYIDPYSFGATTYKNEKIRQVLEFMI